MEGFKKKKTFLEIREMAKAIAATRLMMVSKQPHDNHKNNILWLIYLETDKN